MKCAKWAKYPMGILWECYGYPMARSGDWQVIGGQLAGDWDVIGGLQVGNYRLEMQKNVCKNLHM